MYRQYNENLGITNITYKIKINTEKNILHHPLVETNEIRQMLLKNPSLKPRAMLVINPNNPTGAVLTRSEMESIVKLCVDCEMALIASEVLQESVDADMKRHLDNDIPSKIPQNNYEHSHEHHNRFISFREVIKSMPEPYNHLELFSIYSASKSLISNSAFRIGYLELLNIDSDVYKEMYKHVSIDIATSAVGQVVLDMTISPPSIVEKIYDEAFIKIYNRSLNVARKLQITRKEEILKFFLSQSNLFSVFYPEAGSNFLIGLNKNVLNTNNEEICELYSKSLFEETGIITTPGNAYGKCPHYIVMNINNNLMNMEQAKAMIKFNKKFIDINNNIARYQHNNYGNKTENLKTDRKLML